MTRNIGLAVGAVLLLGVGFWVYSRKKAGLPLLGGPPLYSGYGPGAYGAKSPPVGKAPITSTLQDINGVVQGGDQLLMSGKKAWTDIKGFFGNDTTTTADSSAPIQSDQLDEWI